MAQLRQNHQEFTERNTEIIVIGPENAGRFRDYFSEHKLPYIGIPDPKHTVLKRYGQETKLLKLGRMPAQLLVDRQGIVRFAYYGNSMRDIPSTEKMLDLIDRLRKGKG